jgi:PAS domain S-box-containing protein
MGTEKGKSAKQQHCLSSEVDSKYKSIFDNINVGIFQTTAEGKYLLVNPMLVKIYGFSTTEELIDSFQDIGSQLYVNPYRRMEFVRVMKDKGAVAQFESQIKRKDGTTIWISENAREVHDAGGKFLYYEGTVEDITNLKKAYEQISDQATFLHRAQDAIMVEDLNGHILYWNKSAERLFGWTMTEAITEPTSKFLHATQERIDEARRLLLKHGEWTGVLTKLTKEGKRLVVQARWTLVCNASGQAEAILSINTDITEKRTLEEQLLQTQRLESIGVLASGIAHDLNNIFSPILMATTLLQSRTSDPKAKSLLDTLERSAHRGADLVKQVLAFAKGVSGERSLMQIHHLLMDMQKILEVFPKNIQSKTDFSKELALVLGDATQLHQVILNLCVNARDAMSDGGTLSLNADNITIDEHLIQSGLHQDAKPGPYVVISVGDTGTGIPAEIIHKIYDPFFTTKPPGKGTGLGLSTVLKIVKDHGGFLTLETKVGRGTVFRIFLPAVISGRARVKESEEKPIVRGNGEWILLIDDEISICGITKLSLESYNYNVLTACDGPEALAQFEKNKDKIRLILIDLAMPMMDGPTTIRELQKIKADLDIIVITGMDSTETVELTDDLRVKGCIAKPFSAKLLLAKLAEVLGLDSLS